VICGPGLDHSVGAIEKFVEAGFEHVYIRQIGPDQEGFLEAIGSDVLPRIAGAGGGYGS
jgi:coenzyme F420-dependent glucose-6-phosphate dehydrogenase